MAGACTTKAAQPQELAEGGVRMFQDLREAATAAVKISDLIQPEESPQKGDAGEEPPDADSPEAESDDARPHQQRGAVSSAAADTRELELLHGMFDQVNHAQVLRSDTQENLLLSD